MDTITEAPAYILPGRLNGHSMGIIIKEMARRAMESIYRNRVAFQATQKDTPYKDGGLDFFTNADTEAQQIYLRAIAQSFPTYGVIAEEKDLTIPCTEQDTDIYFTVDPLDGTKAFIRRQSHGIGTMISLVQDGVIIAACVGDVMTGEFYYYRPGSDKVHRNNWRDNSTGELSIVTRPLASQYVLLGDDPRNMSLIVQKLTDPTRKPKVFKDIEVMSGSIGTKLARLWKGEVAAYIIKAGACTPWDWNPVAGISGKLGFVAVTRHRRKWASFPFNPLKRVGRIESDTIIVHQSNVEELMSHLLP
ncbi:MAG TPA: inositol monophosphatase family protein [Candidatus Paceibacterota bacterium]|nr:inositol monophosphatase family protein [Candidatus Paceibacterota bacterium]